MRMLQGDDSIPKTKFDRKKSISEGLLMFKMSKPRHRALTPKNNTTNFKTIQ